MFFRKVAEEMKDDDTSNDAFYTLLEPTFELVQKDIEQGSILILPVIRLDTLEALSKIPDFARVCNFCSRFGRITFFTNAYLKEIAFF